jgi:flagellar assembly factor FliW
MTALDVTPSDDRREEMDAAADQPGIITFRGGIPGFERCRRFQLAVHESLMRLQGMDAPCPALLVVEPRLIYRGYQAALSRSDRRRLDARADDPLLWLVVLTPGTNRVTANLRAPIVINSRRMLGLQVVAGEDYPLAWPLP